MPTLPEEGPPPPLPQTHEPEVTGPGGTGAQPDPLSKLDSELRELAEEGGEEAVTVYVRAKAGADLSGVANVTETRPYLDDELVVAEVEPAMLAKLASHPDVLAAEKFQPVSPPKPISPRSEEVDREELRAKVEELRAEAAELKEAGGEGAPEIPEGVTAPDSPESPEDWNGSDLIGAPEAWAKGYTGEGVNVAILDSGVDFGHPDLEDNIAFYEDGAYEGWPIALDPRSMRQYYYYGSTSWDNYWDDTDYSWYADVRDVLRCTDGMTTSFTFDGWNYTIDDEIVQMSQSGEIRWGAHPDIQLPDYVSAYGQWMPFILVDSTTPGVYDTVIADLNFDFWFDEYDDTAVLGTTDPVLNQDFGSYVYTDTVVMTGTQYIPEGLWWYPPTWYGGWETTVSTATLGAGTYILAENHYTAEGATTGEDGIADISGGMAYFIADGERPIPGMDYLYPDRGPAGMPPIPFNGQLVAFMLGSDYVAGYDHGTLCASAATAGGNITGYFGAFGEKVQYDPEDWSSFFSADDVSEYLPWLKAGDEGTVQGPAPGADIIALGPNYDVINGMQGFYDSYTFLAYGVDGEPNSGDEFVDIASMSYGDGTVHNDGWDWESRLISYYNQTYLPNTTFLASSGNGGHGFGTINSPQGNTTVSVGASTQYGASDVFGSALAADQINDGEVQPFSGRGPDALGRPDPDVTATGAWGAGNTPLNMSGIYNYFVGGGWFPGDGNNAWYEWGGTSRSAPEAAGVTALIYQAYEDAMGSAPDFETARQILMSGADDLNHDVLMQGAGRVNADRATDVAGGLEGVYASPSLLAAGEYEGTHYESFGNVLFPGDTWDQTFTVHNPGAASASVTVGDEVLMEMDVMTYTQVVSPFLGTEGPYPATYYYHADYFVGGDVTTTTHGSDLAIPVPADADLMQVQMVVPFELFDFAYDDPDPSSVSYNMDQRWSLTVYDWEDRNGDGKLWEDTNADGVVSALAGDLVDVSWTGAVTQTEINRFAYGYNYAAEQEVTVRLGDRTDVNNVVLGIVHRNPNTFRPGWGSDEYQEHPLQIKVVFYEKMDWDLVTESPTSLTVPAGGEATFDATFTVPSDQAPGLYEGAITVDDGTHLSIIPTTVNVAVPSDELLFNLGGTEKAGTPYDNGRMFGGWTWSSVLEEGDWRFYYYDADAGFEQQYLYVRNQWGELCDNMPTANETLVWGPNPGDQFSMAEPDKFGPYGMQFAGGTWDAYGPQTGWYNPRRGDWWYGTDGAEPESRVWATLWDGLNQVQFRNILNSGKILCGEEFEATAGVFGVDAPGWEQGGLQVDTDELSGSFELDAISPVDGLIAYAGGFEDKQAFKNQDVPQGKHPDEFPPSDLMDGWVHTFEVTNTWGIEAETFGPWSSDIDLFLLYDANDDGLFNPWDNREWLGVYDTSGDSNEYINYWGNFNNGYRVQDGTYAVVMYGYQVQPGDQFDLHLRTYGGDDLNIEGADASNNYVLDVTPGAAETLTVNWEVPSSGVWHGYMLFAMPHEEEDQYYSMGPSIFVPVVVNAGGIDAGVTKTVDKEWVVMGREVLTYTIEVMNDGNEDAYVQVVDLLPEGVDYHEQWIDDPDEPGDGEWYVAEWRFANGAHGYFWPDGDYIRWGDRVGPGVSGKLTIQYQVKVKDGFVGEIVNKADVTFDYGQYHKFLSSTATTQVARPVFLPIVTRN